MYPLLKTLLLSTAGLIAGETFAAAPVLDVTETSAAKDCKVPNSSASIVEIVSRAGELTRAGNPKAAAKLYADYTMQPDALWFNILFATKMIEGLSCFEQAIAALEWSKTQTNTQYFAHKAESEIDRLTQAAKLHREQAAIPQMPVTASTVAVMRMPEASTDLPSATGAGAMATASAAFSAAENKSRYEKMYERLQSEWRVVAAAEESPQALFFDRDVNHSELTSTAVLELMYGFVIEHPEIYISDLENFGLFTIANYNTTTHAVTIPQVQQLKNKLLHQALGAFAKGQKLYATIVQIGGAGSGHYTVVVIEHDGKVHMINTMSAFVGDSKYDPYAHIQPELVKALNTHKGATAITFTAGSNVRTGIQDADALSNSCGIYSFVYWAALMMTQDMAAYKRVTAAAADGRLASCSDIGAAAAYPRMMDKIVQVDDLSKPNAFRIRYFKNPNAAVQSKFEQELRARLLAKLKELTSAVK